MTDNTKAKPQIKAQKPYEPTPYERRTLEAIRTRNKEKPLAPRIKVSQKKNGVVNLALDHPEHSIAKVRLLEALGTRDFDFLDGLIKQLCNVGSHGRSVDEDGLNFMFAVVKGIEPRDQVEAMLAAQMAAVHNATMTFARRLAHVDNIQQQDSAERAFNKLARTFTSQMEALKRYRSEGQQQIVVKRVTVNTDQAVVTDTIMTGTPAGHTVPSAALLADATEKPMPMLDEAIQPEPVPVGGAKKK